MPQSFCWGRGEPDDEAEGEEHCAVVFPSGKHYDTKCQGVYAGGYEAKRPCVCLFPDAPHPLFELGMEQTRALKPPLNVLGPIIDQIVLIAGCALLSYHGLMLILALRAVVVGYASRERDSRPLSSLLYEACLIFPLCLTTSIAPPQEAEAAIREPLIAIEVSAQYVANARMTANDDNCVASAVPEQEHASPLHREEITGASRAAEAAGADDQQAGLADLTSQEQTHRTRQLQQFGSGWDTRSVAGRVEVSGAA